MRRLALLAALAAAVTAALPAAAAPEAPIALTEEGGALRHEPTGIVMPERLGPWRRLASDPGNPAVVLYGPADAGPDNPRMLAIAVGIAKVSPGVERMRQRSRAHAQGGGRLETLSEGPFGWPGRPGGHSFHGDYGAGDLRKLYWHAWIGGYGITVLAAAPRSEAATIEALAADVAARVFAPAP